VLVARRDDFAGAVHCRLRGRRMSWKDGAIVFQFSRRINTFDALYRLDGAQPVSWRINAMSLASSGVRFNDENLSNPSDGRVAIPLQVLNGAKSISIRPAVGERPLAFDLADLPSALRAAREAGCDAAAVGLHAR
jgi:hypothetical protein